MAGAAAEMATQVDSKRIGLLIPTGSDIATQITYCFEESQSSIVSTGIKETHLYSFPYLKWSAGCNISTGFEYLIYIPSGEGYCRSQKRYWDQQKDCSWLHTPNGNSFAVRVEAQSYFVFWFTLGNNPQVYANSTSLEISTTIYQRDTIRIGCSDCITILQPWFIEEHTKGSESPVIYFEMALKQ